MSLRLMVVEVVIWGRALLTWREAEGFIPEPRWLMSTLQILLIVWGVVTAVLVLLWIYRSTLSMHEDDAMFIDDSSKNMREEQEALQLRMGKITPWVRILMATSGVLILIIAGLAVYNQLNSAG